MECIKYINWITHPHYSIQIDIKDINESIFEKYTNWYYGTNRQTITISPKYIVKGDRFYIDKFISVEDLIKNGKPIYCAIYILGKEIEKLAKHWSEHDKYKDFVMLSNNLDKLIDEATIKNIIE